MPKRPPRPPVEPSEATLFRAAVGIVKPLKSDALEPRAAIAKPCVRDAAAAARELPLATNEPAVEPEASLSFRRSGVTETQFRRLRRAQLGIDAKLDLHGENLRAARFMVDEFLVECQQAARRCVLIVHGKGYRSGERGPILKSAVNGWLQRESAVLAFVSARPVHGGTGALYVLLRN
jgi:DNA-nicking Smr family endonuclease